MDFAQISQRAVVNRIMICGTIQIYGYSGLTERILTSQDRLFHGDTLSNLNVQVFYAVSNKKSF
jgi:hypothetical protein